MENFRRRLRAALKMGLLWAAAGFSAGFLLARVSTMNPDLPFALLFAPLGFAAAITSSGVLAVVEGRGRIGPTSRWAVAAWGAVSGLLLSSLFVAGAAIRGDSLWAEFLLFGPTLALGSAACAAGSMALANRGHGREQRGRRGTAV